MRSPILNVMANAALKAARGLIRDLGEVEQLQVSVKGPGEFVSTADLKAERTLRAELTRARPGYALLFEESGETAGSDPRHRWIVDPLDGTTNFLLGIPHFSISIALDSDGEIVAGIRLVREAGGYVRERAGGHDMLTTGDVRAANDHLHLPFAALIREALRGGRPTH